MGLVYFIQAGDEEAEEFPGGDHDDMVDALSGAYAELARGAAFTFEPEPETAPSITGDLLTKEL